LNNFDRLHLTRQVTSSKEKEQLLGHLRKMLGQNPGWIWTLIEAIPMEEGFLCKWMARIPAGGKVIECIGV
jgi:hypothetical protein